MPIEPSLTIRRRLPAPPSLVFQAWTDPDRFGRWFGPPGAELVEAEMEPRAGGRYRILMRAGGEEHGVGGVYREVVPDERLVFTWAWRSTPEREIAGHGAARARGRPDRAHAPARAVLRPPRPRPPPRGLDAGPGQAGSLPCLSRRPTRPCRNRRAKDDGTVGSVGVRQRAASPPASGRHRCSSRCG